MHLILGLSCVVTHMKLTPTPPAEEGWYWYANDDQSDYFIVYVDIEGRAKGIDSNFVVWEFHIDDGGVWSPNPLNEPSQKFSVK